MKRILKTIFMGVLLMGSFALSQAQTRKLEVDINGGKQFSKIQEAIDYIASENLRENIDIVIYPGIYPEQIILKDIADYSDTYKLHLYSSTNQKSDVSIQHNKKVIVLKGANYSLSHLNIINTTDNGATAEAFTLENDKPISNIHIDNCSFQGYEDATNAWTEAVVSLSSSYGISNVSITNSIIRKGSIGILLFNTHADLADNIVLKKNQFINQTHRGIKVIKAGQLNIEENNIANNAASGADYMGLEIWNGKGDANIAGNTINLNSGSRNVGIQIQGNEATNAFMIKNNFIRISGNAYDNVGIHDWSNSRVRIYHNTILVTGGSSASVRGIFVNRVNTHFNDLKIKNNIVENSSGHGYALYVEGHKNYISEMRNNAWYGNATHFARFYGTDCNSLESLAAATGMNENAVFEKYDYKYTYSPQIEGYFQSLITDELLPEVTKFHGNYPRGPRITMLGAGVASPSGKVKIKSAIAEATTAIVTAEFIPFKDHISEIKLFYGQNKDNLDRMKEFSPNVVASDEIKTLSATATSLVGSTTYYYSIESIHYGRVIRTPVRSFKTKMNVAAVQLDVAQGLLQNTVVGMEYSIAGKANWKACTANQTANVVFAEGEVWVREKADPTNERMVADLQTRAMPEEHFIGVEYIKEGLTIYSDDLEYAINGGAYTTIPSGFIAIAPEASTGADKNLSFRYKATSDQLASAVRNVLYPKRTAAPAGMLLNTELETLIVPAFDLEWKQPGSAKYEACNQLLYPVSAIIPANGEADAVIKFRKPANEVEKRFNSEEAELILKARPASPSYNIDFQKEELIEDLNTSIEYAGTANFMNAQSTTGTLKLNVPAVGSEDAHLFFRTKHTADNFRSENFDLLIPARKDCPVVKLQMLADPLQMIYVKDANTGNFREAVEGDNLEYTTDKINWKNVKRVAFSTSGVAELYVRKKATNTEFISNQSANLIAPPSVANLDIDISKGLILNTSNLLSYKYKGEARENLCQSGNTVHAFKAGTLQVYETIDPANKKSFVIAAAEDFGQTFNIDFVQERVQEIVLAGTEIEVNGEWRTVPSDMQMDLFVSPVDYGIKFRKKATKTKLASKLYTLNVPAAPAAPLLTFEHANKKLRGFTTALEYMSNISKDVELKPLNEDPAHTSISATDYLDLTPFISEANEANQYVHVRKKSTSTSFRSLYATYKVHKKHADLVPQIDFAAESFSPKGIVEYNFAEGEFEGKAEVNDALFLYMIQSANTNRSLKIRMPDGADYYASNYSTIEVPKRRQAPELRITNKESEHAVFEIKKAGSWQQATTADELEYHLNGFWHDLEDNTEIITTGTNNVKARRKANATDFKSEETGNLDEGVVMGDIDYHVKDQKLLHTTAEMEYSLNSTNGEDGDWTACTDSETENVAFVAGEVYVREIRNTNNKRRITTLYEVAATYIDIDFAAEKTVQSIMPTMEYATKADFSDAQAGKSQSLDLEAGKTYYFRTQATQYQLASNVTVVEVPVRPVISSTQSGTVDNPRIEIVIDFKQDVSTPAWGGLRITNALLDVKEAISKQKFRVVLVAQFEGEVRFQVQPFAVAEGCFASNALSFNYQKPNTAPYVNTPPGDQAFDQNTDFEIQLAAKTFKDDAAMDVLTIKAQLADGSALPSWLNFNDMLMKFDGNCDTPGEYDIELIATDNKGLTAKTSFKLTINTVTTAIDDIFGEQLKLYPNVFVSMVNFENIPENAQLVIYGLSGVPVKFHQATESSFSLDLSQLASGIYFVQIESEGQKILKKIIKK